MLVSDGLIHLKTDSQHLYNYTNAVVDNYGLTCNVANGDIYGSGYADERLSIKTAYEMMFLQRGLPITYTQFSLDGRREFEWFDWEGDEIDREEKDNEENRERAF